MRILVPLIAGDGEKLEKDWFNALLQELTDRFGGATSFIRSPGQGHWDSGKEKGQYRFDRGHDRGPRRRYWDELKTRLEKELSQSEIMIRALPVTSFESRSR